MGGASIDQFERYLGVSPSVECRSRCCESNRCNPNRARKPTTSSASVEGFRGVMGARGYGIAA
jgi:hypothetical protein